MARRLVVDAATFRRFHDAYSADRIADKGRVQILAFDGRLYTCTGAMHTPGQSDVLYARRLYPRSAWPFRQKPLTYQQRVDSNVHGEGFYTGILVKHGGREFVLGPERYQVRQASPKQKARRSGGYRIVAVSLYTEQAEWLDREATRRRTTRSAIVQQLIERARLNKRAAR